MEDHRRWLCQECKREWIDPTFHFVNSAPVTITGNPKTNKNCPVCGSPEIELIEYRPEYPGLDIPRDKVNKVIPVSVISEVSGSDRHKADVVKIFGDRKAEDLVMPPIVQPEERNNMTMRIEYDLSDMD